MKESKTPILKKNCPILSGEMLKKVLTFVPVRMKTQKVNKVRLSCARFQRLTYATISLFPSSQYNRVCTVVTYEHYNRRS